MCTLSDKLYNLLSENYYFYYQQIISNYAEVWVRTIFPESSINSTFRFKKFYEGLAGRLTFISHTYFSNIHWYGDPKNWVIAHRFALDSKKKKLNITDHSICQYIVLDKFSIRHSEEAIENVTDGIALNCYLVKNSRIKKLTNKDLKNKLEIKSYFEPNLGDTVCVNEIFYPESIFIPYHFNDKEINEMIKQYKLRTIDNNYEYIPKLEIIWQQFLHHGFTSLLDQLQTFVYNYDQDKYDIFARTGEDIFARIGDLSEVLRKPRVNKTLLINNVLISNSDEFKLSKEIYLYISNSENKLEEVEINELLNRLYEKYSYIDIEMIKKLISLWLETEEERKEELEESKKSAMELSTYLVKLK